MPMYRFPKDYYSSQHSSGGQEAPPFQGKLPDYIYIGDERDPSAGAEEVSEGASSTASKRFGSGAYPLFFRLVTLVGGVVMAAWAGVLATAAAIAALAAVLVFWRPTDLGDKAQSFWKRACKMSAVSLALCVATLSPAFGLGIAGLYFAQRGEKKPSFFSRFF